MSRGGTLRGKLRDAAGKPVVGGKVSLRPAPNSGLMVYYDAKSGVDGQFVFANVQPGSYTLSGARPGGGDANPLEVIQDVKSSQKPVTVSDNENTVLDLQLGE
jgi:hypothetical protein